MKAGWLAAALAAAACQGAPAARTEAPPSASTAPTGPAVATMAHDAITLQAYLDHLEEQPPTIRAQYTASMEKKKEFLEGMIRFRVMLAAARAEGFEGDPDLKATEDRRAVERLVKTKFGDKGSEGLTPAEVQAYADRHPEMKLTELQARVQLWRERQQKALDAYVERLRQERHVTVDEAELAKVDVGVPGRGAPSAATRR